MEDQQKLKGLLGNEGAFSKPRGQKECGGFHPDYCVEFRVAAATYRWLICFGCAEVMVYGPEDSLHYDIDGDTYKQLQALLKNYRKNRPPPEEQ